MIRCMRTSPFPGMDPYLETPSLWRGVHTRLITLIADTLAPRLAPAFTVAIEERVYIAPLVEEEVHERYLEIRDTRTHAVLTIVEVLSPANKGQGTEGRSQFMRKRRLVLGSQTHWIEIDLLRGGERPPEVRGRGDYYALLHRSDPGAPYEVWTASLRDRLPVIAVPTRSPVPDLGLDLQAIVETIYARGVYAEILDYDQPPPPPALSADDAEWVRERITRWRAERGQDGVSSPASSPNRPSSTE